MMANEKTDVVSAQWSWACVLSSRRLDQLSSKALMHIHVFMHAFQKAFPKNAKPEVSGVA